MQQRLFFAGILLEATCEINTGWTLLPRWHADLVETVTGKTFLRLVPGGRDLTEHSMEIQIDGVYLFQSRM